MPTYTIELDGKRYKLAGDHPPTEEEARAAVAAFTPPETAIQSTSSEPTDIFHKSFWENLSGIAQGALSRVKDVAKSLPLMALDPLGTETAKITGQGETQPAPALLNLMKRTVTEPVRIGQQLGQGTPEAVGQSLVDTAAYLPAVIGLTRASGPLAAGAKQAVATHVPKAIGNVARAIPPHATDAVGAALGGYYGGVEGAMAGGLGGGVVNKLISKAKTLGVPNPNAGGRLVPGSPPLTLDEALSGALGELSMEGSAVPLSHPTGGGFTVPPEGASGRLVPRTTSAPPSLNTTLQGALEATQQQPSGVRVGLGARAGGGYTVPTEVPQPPVTFSEEAANVLQKLSKPGARVTPPSPTQMERLYRQLSRKPILTPEDTAVLARLEAILKDRASRVGMSFAAGGKRGIP